MSLTATDLQLITRIVRDEIREEVRAELSVQLWPIDTRLRNVETRLDNVDGRLEAVENDIKEIYLLSGEKTTDQENLSTD